MNIAKRPRVVLQPGPTTLILRLVLTIAATELVFAIAEGRISITQVVASAIIAGMLILSQLATAYVLGKRRKAVDTNYPWVNVLGALVGGIFAEFTLALLRRPLDLELANVTVVVLLAVVFAITFAAFFRELKPLVRSKQLDLQPTIVVGSGGAAASLVKLIQENENFKYSVVGCVDDNIISARVSGTPVLGSIDALPDLISRHQIGCVIIAIPSAPTELMKRVMSICVKSVGRGGEPPSVKVLPGVLETLEYGIKGSRIRPVLPEDLLPREPVKVDLAEIAPHVANRVILVTGAGGSIGSELSRQIVTLNPSLLLLLGHGENSLFDIDEELKLKLGFARTKIILADVADAPRMRAVFSEYRPHVVFHCAAHKHVPIVESNVCEAVQNNILGTHVVALAAAAAGTAKFVLLSTDKAVNPASVMGATKRVSELISQSFFNQTGTEFVTVRFGNVLESRGSVIPIFKRQIEAGGPVTITHRDMQRYFMTIPEAASLVLMAMAIGRDGQVLVLDMGEPVKISNLAETLITLSGLTPYRDISIVEIGIRPGEKLFEEIMTSYEGLSRTSHSRIFIAQQERIAYDALAHALARLEAGVRTGKQGTVLDLLQELVPTFKPGPHHVDGSVDRAAQVVEAQSDYLCSFDSSAPNGNGQPAQVVVAEPPANLPRTGAITS